MFRVLWKRKKTLEKKTRPPIELGLGRSHRGELFDELLSNVVIKKKKGDLGRYRSPDWSALCVYNATTIYVSIIPPGPPNNTEKLKFKVYPLIKECEMSSCTPCHDGLLHRNHKIQTTWLYNTRGCAFQNLNFHGVLHAISYVRDNLP